MTNQPNASPCPNCKGRSFHWTKAGANGAYGPHLLPGLGLVWDTAEVHVVVCADCGLMRLFADGMAHKKLAGGKTGWHDWRRLELSTEGSPPAGA